MENYCGGELIKVFVYEIISEVVNERGKVKWVFLTLTVRNVEGKGLKPTMDQMTQAWNRFAGYAKFKK